MCALLGGQRDSLGDFGTDRDGTFEIRRILFSAAGPYCVLREIICPCGLGSIVRSPDSFDGPPLPPPALAHLPSFFFVILVEGCGAERDRRQRVFIRRSRLHGALSGVPAERPVRRLQLALLRGIIARPNITHDE